MIALSCKDIKKEYGTDVILNNISFAVNEGDKVALIGANGVGKTTLAVNLAGLPGLCLPAGKGKDSGLPVGLQIMGRAFDEEGLIRTGSALEAALPHPGMPPF